MAQDGDRFARSVRQNLRYWHRKIDGATNAELFALRDKFALIRRAIQIGVQRETIAQEAGQLALTASRYAEQMDSWAEWIAVLDVVLAQADPLLTDALLLQKGLFCRLVHQFEEAIVAYGKVRKSAENHDPCTFAKATIGLATCDLTRGDYQNAEHYLTSSVVELVANCGDSRLSAQTANTLGWLHFLGKGNLALAKENFEKALEGYEQQGDLLNCARVLHNLGNVHIELQRPVAAQTYFERVNELHKVVGTPVEIALAKLSLGSLYYQQQEWRKAEQAFTSIDLPYLERHNYVRWQALALGNLGNILFEQEKLPKAREHLERAAAMQSSGQNQNEYANTLIILGKTYMQEGEWQQARAYFQKSIQILEANSGDTWSIKWLAASRELLMRVEDRLPS